VNEDHSYQDEELIPVVYGRDLTEAYYYKSLLDNHEIPAVVTEEAALEDSDEDESGIPVLVPEDYLAEAQDILEQSTSDEDDFDEDEDEDEDDLAGFQEEDSDLETF
jgi:hypothetical protein